MRKFDITKAYDSNLENPIIEDKSFNIKDAYKNIGNSFDPQYQEYVGGISGLGGSKFDYTIKPEELQNLGKIRGERQPWYEQTVAMLQQAVVGEVIGGTFETIGTILAIPEILGGDYSMDNPFMNLGKAIRESSRDLTPIYQTGDRFSDFGYWAQGLVSVASSASMMLPGWGITKGVEWATKGLKWGTTAMKMAQTGISALGMRHIEGAREANEVYNQLKQLGLESNQQLKGEFAELKAMEDAEIAALPLQMPNPETRLTYSNEDRINQIREKYNKSAQNKIELAANAGARLTYIADYSNIVFDMLQMGAILKPLSAYTRNIGNLGYKVAKTADKLPTSKLGKVGYRLMDTGKYGLIEMTEGIEEQINFISAKEGEREGRIQLGLEKDEGSTFTERLGGYVKEDEFWDSFIFGAIGGVGFKGLMKAAGMDENAGIVNRKIAEIQGREQIIKDRATLIKDVISDSKKSTEEKKEFLKSQLKDTGFETGIRGSAAGNVDLLLEWANDPKLAEEIANMGFGDVGVIRELMPEFRKGIEQAENLYKKHYTGLYEYNTSEAVKRVLIADRINLDRQIQENLENLKILEREGIELKTKDNWLQVKGTSVENNNMLNQYVNMQTIAQLQKDLQEANTPETKAAIQTVIDNIKQENNILAQEMFKMEKEAKDLNIPFTKPNLEDITAVDNRLIVNMAEQKILRNINNVWVKELENKAKKETVNKDVKEAEELVKAKAKESEELLKANKKAEAEAKARARQEAANKKKAEEEAKKQGKTQPVDVPTTSTDITKTPEDAKTKGTQPTDGEFTEEFEDGEDNFEELTKEAKKADIEQEETSNENTAKQQNIVDDAHSDVTGNNPEKVIPDNEIQSEEINLYDYKSESSLITGYKATGYTASGTTLAKKTFNYTDISPYALDLSHSKILPDGAEVKLSLETDFDGKVAVYDNGVRVLKEDGAPYYENKTYDQIESSDEKPIKIVYTIGNKEVIIGHLPTVSWANAKDKNDEYENIANDVSRGRDAAAEVEKLRQFRKYIVEQGEDKTYTFKVTKGYGFIVNNLVDGKKVKGTVSQNLPNLTTSGFFTGEFKPFTIFKKGKFKTSKTGNFSTNNILISPETLAKLSKSYNGSVFVMIPSGIDGTFIPKPLEYNTLNESTAKALIHIIKEVSNNNTAVINDIFAKYGISVSSRAGLRQFLSKFIFLPANTNEGTERIAPRIVFDVQNSKIDVIKNWESVTKVDLNNKKTREASLDKLLPYLTQQKITVREDMLNSNEDFYIPSLKIDEKGNTYIDYSKTTNTKWLQDNLLTDAGELKTSNDSGNKPVYVVQSTLKLNGEIQTIPEKPSAKKDEVAPTPKKSRPKAGKVAKETKTQVNGVDLTTDNTNYVKPEEDSYEGDLAISTAEIKPGVAELLESNPKLANVVYAALGFTGNISLESNLKNTGKTEQELIEYLQKKYPEIKLNIFNNPVWEKGKDILNQIIENEMNEEYWRNLYTQKNISNREEFESVKIPTIKNKFKPDFENIYHGTNTYEVDSEGNLILVPSENFDSKTMSISFTQIPVVAQDYMLRKNGNIIIKINNKALGSNYDIESVEEIAVNGNQLFIVPKGQYEIITVSTLAEKMRKKYANEAEIRAEELKNNEKSDLHLIDAIYSEIIAADNYSELQEYADVDISEQAPEWYVPDEYLDSRAAKKVYESIRNKINKEWIIDTLSNALIEQIKNTGEYTASIETALNDMSTYGGRYAPHQSTLFEELLNEIGLGYSQRSTFLKEGEKLIKAKQKQEEYNELLNTIESLVEKEAEKSVKYYNSPEQLMLREEQKQRDKINREITQNLGKEEADELPFQKIGNKIIGQANIKAMTVLVDAVNKKADTIPHEYAHHYIAWFRNTPIVQEGIKRFGSEEALVQAIGEQVVKQKGEAYNWWKKFTNFIINLLSDKQLLQILTDSFLNRTNLNTDFTYNQITPQQKQQAQQVYSQYLDSLNKPNTNPILQTNQQEQVKKFTELQERLNNKEFLKGAKNAYENSKELKSFGTQEQYNDYIARVSLGITKNPSSGDYNYTSKVKDIVYHYSMNKFEKFDKQFLGKNTNKDKRKVGYYFSDNRNLAELLYGTRNVQDIDLETGELIEKQEKGFGITAILNNPEIIKENDDISGYGDYVESNSYIVFEPEQIHILSSKADIEGFKEFVNNQSDASISTTQRVDIKEGSKSLLITDGDYTFTAPNQREVTNEIKSFVYTNLLSVAKEGKRMAVSKAFNIVKKDMQEYLDIFEYLSGLTQEEFNSEEEQAYLKEVGLSHIKSVNDVKRIYEERKRILKPEVWDRFRKEVIQDLKNLGITVKEENLENLTTEQLDEIEGIEDDYADVDIVNTDNQNEKNHSLETFNMDLRNTASINVKLMLSKIADTRHNYISGVSLIPFDSVFEELKMMLSPLDGDIDTYIEAIKEIANNNSSKSYFRNLVRELESPETSTQIKNQFVEVMNTHAGNFMMLSWKKNDKASFIRLVNSNRNSAHNRILENWAENMKYSDITKTNDKNQTIVDADVAKSLVEGVKQADKGSKEEKIAFIKRLFDALGMTVPQSAIDVLVNTEDYKTLIGNNNKGIEGSFEGQFGFTNAGEPYGVFSKLVYSLTEKATKEEVEATEDVIELNNPFIGTHKNSSAEFLARVVALHSKNLFNSSHKSVEGKTIWDFSYHIPITSRFKELNKNSVLRNELLKLSFSSTAMYLQEDYAGVKLIMNDLDGIKHDQKGQDGITRKNMSYREQEFASIGYFQQQLENSAYYVGLTMSDKTRSPIVEAPKLNIEILPTALNGKYLTREALSPNVRKQIGNLVIAESARIRIMYDKIQEATKNGTLNELKDEVGIQYFEGSQYFYFFPQLNDLVRDEKGELDITKLLNEDLEVLIDSAMDKVVESVNSTIDVWNEIGVVKDGEPILFNNTYRNKHNKYKGDALVAFGAADIDINTLLFNANMMQLVMGDPAKYYNPKKVNGIKDYTLRIQAVMEEYQKREAKDSAPGALGNTKWEIKRGDKVYRGREKYTVAFAEDDTHGSLTEGYLSTLSNYIGKIDRSDAQEYTTVQEKIDVLMNHGKIADDVYVAITEKIKAAGKGGYYTLTKDELLIVLQPDKPVQVYHDITDNNYEHTYYIKSSSFPLIPELTKDFDIDKVRVAMENGGVDRLAYVTATKTGARKVTKVFNSDGSVVENLSFENRISILDRSGFAIQQDVPYDAEKKEITLISQMDRLLMQGLSDYIFTWGADKNVKGSTLKKLKENVRGQLMDLSKDELFKRIGIELKDGSPVFTDKSKLLEVLREEAIDRKWSINDIESLEINDNGNVVIPLAFNNSSERIETLITAMFSKIIKQKMHGKSLVQGSSSGFKNNVKTLADLTSNDSNGIIYVGNKFDPKKGLQFVTHFDGGKIVQKAQVFLPWKFSGNIKDFLIEGTNTLDLTKVDEELLTIIGARIPNQGHSSQLIIEIVGFLPEVMGDLIIVPGEITKQMGSDFDVDKLYTYIYNNIVNDKGQLKKIPAAVDIDGNLKESEIKQWINENFKDKIKNLRAFNKYVKELKETSKSTDDLLSKMLNMKLDDDIDFDNKTLDILKDMGLTKEDIRIPSVKKLQRQILQNAYTQIHENVLSNPKVIELLTQALDADDLKVTGDVGKQDIQKGLFISRGQQLRDFKMQQEGKNGVAIYSRAVVGSAMIEDYNVRLGGYEDGKPVDVFFTGFKGYKLGRLSGLGESDFDGKRRSKVRNLIIQQSGAVDNAKDPVLTKNNLNMYTFNVSIVLSQLSTEDGKALNLKYNSYFLKQEAIEMYIEELSKLSDSLNDAFVPDRKEAAVNAVNERLQSRLDDPVAVDKTMDFSLEEMQELLTTDETNSENYVKSQLALLEHFIFLDTVGQELSEIYGALSTESKGVGKGYWELAKKQEQYESVGKKTMIIGTDKLLKDNQSGKIYSYVQDAMKVMEQLFPYQTENVKTAINMIESIAGKTRIDADLRFSIWQNMKSYMFSDPTLDTMSEDKTNLFYGENSVAKQLKAFVESDEGKTNLFANKLRYKTATKEGYPDMIFFNAAASERTDEQELVKHFIDMFISDNESTRNLAERLVHYAYATGGVQQALQFVKYVPVAYLKTTNFGSRLVQLSDMLSSETFNTDIFIEQYFQHNPGKARKYNVEQKFKKTKAVEVGDSTKTVKDVDIKRIEKIAKEGITFDLEIDDITGIQHTVNKEQVPVNFLVVRDVENNKWILLKNTEINGNNIVYKPIPTLGGNGKDYTAYNEYSFGKENTISTIADNNPEGFVTPVIEPTIVPQPKETNEKPLVNKDRTEVMASRYVDIYGAKGRKALEFTLSQIQSEKFKPLIPLFVDNADSLLPTFEIVIDNKLTDGKGNLAKGLYDTKTSILSINPKTIENNIKLVKKREVTPLDIERVLIHELTHAYTSNLYNIYKEGKTHKLLTSKVIESFKNIEKLLNVVESKLTLQEKEALKKLREKKYSDLSTRDKTILYGLTNPKEFIAEALTNKEFQEYLNSIDFDKTRTLWDRLNEFIKTIYNEFIKTLGFTVNQNTVLSHTLMETINLIERTETKTTQQKGVEISSNSKGLAAALTNPTELAKSKGNLSQSYPIKFKGRIKPYDDVEQAFQALKNKDEANTKPSMENSSNYKLMVDLITAKLQQYPRLVSEITEQGGSEWILASTHQPTKQNTVWETGGKNWFIKALNEAYKSTQQNQREYTPENITTLKPNEVFVFGANTAGGHGGGTAGLAQRGTTSSNYTALPIGTKGKWSEYGVVDKLMQGTKGKSFGIVTKAASINGTSLKIGSKRSVPLSRIGESINKLIETANQNPNLKFLVTKFGTNMAGFTIEEMKSLLVNKNLPDNIVLPKEFEVREELKSTQPTTTEQQLPYDGGIPFMADNPNQGSHMNKTQQPDASISTQSQINVVSLGTTVGEYMKSLTKEERLILRSMMNNNEIKFKCK